jgi:carboxymethylenebutenolidase
MVSFPSNGSTAEGYLATPAAGRGPGVVVIQEWWGLNDNIKQIADRFAAEGFVALAPDLYHGKLTAEPDEAQKLMMSFNMQQAAKDMSGAYDLLKNHAASTGKIGSVGFCMGGGLSLTLATLRPIDACVVYYGVAEPDVSKLQGPVLMHFAQNDAWASPDAGKRMADRIKDAGQKVELHVYPGTEHAFFNDTRAEVYNEQAARQSWDRTLAFYRQHLG